jgi:hypothetical protein
LNSNKRRPRTSQMPPRLFISRNLYVPETRLAPIFLPTSWIGLHSVFHMTSTCRPPSVAVSPLVPARIVEVSFPSSALMSLQTADVNIGLSGFDLAESIWSQDSDLTLDDLALSFDSASSRSSMSSHWSAPPLTPPTFRHFDLRPPLDPAPSPAEAPVQDEPEEPDSPAPAYSRDPLEFDPAILASLDSQLRLRPFEAFEDMCWASCFSDPAPVQVAHSSQSQTVTLSLNHSSTSCLSFSADSAFSDTSTTTMLPYPPPSPPPSQPPPAYPTSKPLPTIPPPSPMQSMAEHDPHSPSVVVTFKSPIVSLENSPILPATPVEAVQLIPLRPQIRPRSKSVGGPKTVQRLTTAIARLRGRE